MIGQDRLVAKLKSYSIATLPHSILLLGDSGCGKHTFVKELADVFCVSIVDITDSISLDAITEISNRPIPTFYLIDCSEITERHQNIILKFLEEPLQYVYVFLLCTNESLLLPTILNRCVKFKFEPYSREVLKQFLNGQNEKLLDVCTTPGQLLSIHANDLDELKKLCDTIVTRIGKANYPNTLSIVRKINLKDEFDKFDIEIFFNVLLLTIYNKVLSGENLLNLYNLVLDYKKRLRDSRLNKELLLENFLTTLWEFMR